MLRKLRTANRLHQADAMLSRAATTVGFVTALSTPQLATAGLIEGRADSDGYTAASQPACCAQVILAARDDAAQVCRKTGGASRTRGVTRRIASESGGHRPDESGRKQFRCSATSTLDCRSPQDGGDER